MRASVRDREDGRNRVAVELQLQLMAHRLLGVMGQQQGGDSGVLSLHFHCYTHDLPEAFLIPPPERPKLPDRTISG